MLALVAYSFKPIKLLGHVNGRNIVGQNPLTTRINVVTCCVRLHGPLEHVCQDSFEWAFRSFLIITFALNSSHVNCSYQQRTLRTCEFSYFFIDVDKGAPHGCVTCDLSAAVKSRTNHVLSARVK